jgi:hypothetical protein
LKLRAEVEKARDEYNDQIESLRSRQLETHRKLEQVRQWFFTSIIDNEGRADFQEHNTEVHNEVRAAESDLEEAVQSTRTLEESQYRKELRLMVTLMDIQTEIVGCLERDETSNPPTEGYEAGQPIEPAKTTENPYLAPGLRNKIASSREQRADIERSQEAVNKQIRELLDDEETQHQLFLTEKANYFNRERNNIDNPQFQTISRENLAAYEEAEERYQKSKEKRVDLERGLLRKEKDFCQVFMEIQDLTQAFPGTLHIFGLPVQRPCSAVANDTEASSNEGDSSEWVHVKYCDGEAIILGPKFNS